MTGPGPYVESAAVVAGRPAAVLDRVLSAPRVAAVLDRLGDAEVDATRAAIRSAAKAYEQATATRRSSETRSGEDRAGWPVGVVTSAQAAELLGVGLRRVQQLAAGGLGRRVAGRWVLDRDEVEHLAAERREAEVA